MAEKLRHYGTDATDNKPARLRKAKSWYGGMNSMDNDYSPIDESEEFNLIEEREEEEEEFVNQDAERWVVTVRWCPTANSVERKLCLEASGGFCPSLVQWATDWIFFWRRLIYNIQLQKCVQWDFLEGGTLVRMTCSGLVGTTHPKGQPKIGLFPVLLVSFLRTIFVQISI